MPWKILENEFGPGTFWKLKFKVLESPGIYLWFKLYNRHSAEFGPHQRSSIAVKIQQQRLAAGALPLTRWGSLQHSPSPIAGGRALAVPSPRTSPPQPLASTFVGCSATLCILSK